MYDRPPDLYAAHSLGHNWYTVLEALVLYVSRSCRYKTFSLGHYGCGNWRDNENPTGKSLNDATYSAYQSTKEMLSCGDSVKDDSGGIVALHQCYFALTYENWPPDENVSAVGNGSDYPLLPSCEVPSIMWFMLGAVALCTAITWLQFRSTSLPDIVFALPSALVRESTWLCGLKLY